MFSDTSSYSFLSECRKKKFIYVPKKFGNLVLQKTYKDFHDNFHSTWETAYTWETEDYSVKEEMLVPAPLYSYGKLPKNPECIGDPYYLSNLILHPLPFFLKKGKFGPPLGNGWTFWDGLLPKRCNPSTILRLKPLQLDGGLKSFYP